MEEHSLTKPSSYCGVRSLTPSATVSRQRLTTSHPVTALHQPARRDAAKDGMTACSESIFQKKPLTNNLVIPFHSFCPERRNINPVRPRLPGVPARGAPPWSMTTPHEHLISSQNSGTHGMTD